MTRARARAVARIVAAVVAVAALGAGCASSAGSASHPDATPRLSAVPSAAFPTPQPEATAETSVAAPAPTSPAGTVAPRAPTVALKPAPRLSAAPADVHQASTRTALALLATIPVKGRAPKTGYARSAFGTSWTDDNGDPLGHNGCDTRNDILDRDLARVVYRSGTHECVVLTGTLHDPYTGKTISFVRGQRTSRAVQIDHVVALSNAWQTGAKYWGRAKRIDLANDPLNLLAVDGPTNESKGDGDAATWLPPNKAYRCAYVARQVAVKARYGLWMTRAEHDAIKRVLSACPGQRAPGESGAPRSGVAHPTTHSAPKPAPRTSTHKAAPKPPPPASTCEPGYSPCLPIVGDLDCGQIPDSKKPIHVTGDDPYRLDRDNDGVACEP